jgi:hypothetical protein
MRSVAGQTSLAFNDDLTERLAPAHALLGPSSRMIAAHALPFGLGINLIRACQLHPAQGKDEHECKYALHR